MLQVWMGHGVTPGGVTSFGYARLVCIGGWVNVRAYLEPYMNKLETRQAELLSELRALIEQARQYVAHTANSALTMLYWHMGARISRELLAEGRAEYGSQVVSTLAVQLVQAYGKGFTATALTRMVKFAECFPDQQIVATLSQQFSWSLFVTILP